MAKRILISERMSPWDRGEIDNIYTNININRDIRWMTRNKIRVPLERISVPLIECIGCACTDSPNTFWWKPLPKISTYTINTAAVLVR